MTSPRAWNLLKEQQRGVPLDEESVGKNGASLEVEVPLEAIVFRPRKWQSAEGSAQPGDVGGFVVNGSQPLVEGAEGTQQRFWVAPTREEQGDVSLESASILIENDWSMDSGSEGLYTLATTGSCLPFRSDISSHSPPEAAGTTSALRPTTPPLLGSAIAGATLPFFGGTAETPPSARRTVQADIQQSRRMAGHSSTPQIPVQSSADSREGTRLRAPSPDVSGRSWSAGARRFDQQSVAGSRPKSPRTNNRTGTPLATRRPATENRSRSGTPSKNQKRFSTGSIRVSAGQATISGGATTSDRRRVPRIARESGERLSNLEMNRRARSASPEDREHGNVAGNGALGRRSHAVRAAPAKSPERSVELEAENHQLRVEVSDLRAELRDVLRELQARTQDLREVSSLLARHQGNPSTSNLADGLSDGRIGNISGVQLSDLSADSITDNGVGHSSILAVPGAAKSPVVRIKKGCSLGLTPPPTPSPRVDARILN